MIPRQGFRVLCVDDSEEVLKVLRLALESFGYDVDTAVNGYAALQRVTRKTDYFQLVMTDLRMPGMSGIELIEQTRSSGYLGPYIVYAAHIAPDDRTRLRELRVLHVIDKPARVGELISAIKEVQSSF